MRMGTIRRIPTIGFTMPPIITGIIMPITIRYPLGVVNCFWWYCSTRSSRWLK